MSLSPINLAVFDLLSNKQTYRQTDILLLYSKDTVPQPRLKYDCSALPVAVSPFLYVTYCTTTTKT